LFNLDLVELPKVKQVNEEGSRYYTSDGEVKYPSVTTILGADPEKIKSLQEWRKRVGEEKANQISRQAATKGTNVHACIEAYIQNQEVPEVMPHEMESFLLLKSAADKYIDNIKCIEGKMLSHHLRCAGTVDCVANYRGKMAIIDWKTSARLKKKTMIDGYFKQAAAYSVMFEENTGIPVEQLIIIMACGTGQLQLFKENRDDWIDKFISQRDYYEQEWTK
jgi:genome maintenance exonuclease 1